MSDQTVDFSTETLQQAREPFMDYMRKEREVSELSLTSYGRDFDLFERYFKPEKLVQKIMPPHVTGFLKSEIHLKRQNGKDRAKPSTDKTARLLRMFLEWCEATGRVEKAPILMDTKMGAKSKREREKALKEREARNKASEEALAAKEAKKAGNTARTSVEKEPSPGTEPQDEQPESSDQEAK